MSVATQPLTSPAVDNEQESYEVYTTATNTKVAEVDAIRDVDGLITGYKLAGTDTDRVIAPTEDLRRFYREPSTPTTAFHEEIAFGGAAAWAGVRGAGAKLTAIEVKVNVGSTATIDFNGDVLTYASEIVRVEGNDVRNVGAITMTAGTGRVLWSETV